MRWILVAALLLVAGTTPALADISRYACELYFADSELVPPEAPEWVRPDSHAALKVCSNPFVEDSTTFAHVFAPLRHPFGVCQMIERQLFKDGETWTYTPPQGESDLGGRLVSMMISEGDCPRQDDSRYIGTNDVSPGVFLASVRFWKELSSRDGHDALIAAVYPAVRSGPMFQDFEREIRRGAEFELVGVSFVPADESTPAFYKMDLEGTRTNWALLVDVMDDGLVVVGIGTIEY